MSLSVRFEHQFVNLELKIAFEAPTPGVTALFGPSGCGKSTVIMVVAGLLRPSRCRIALDGTILADTDAGFSLPAERRRIGMVFQDSRLFPHMSVLRNLEFGRRRMGSGSIHLDDVVDLLGIGLLLDRRPNSLSGGERQRVAIGRALLAQPLLLAMDEPLASLDGPRKSEILPFLTRLKTALKLPILYVTHATEELASIADTLVLLENGQVVAIAPLEEAMTRNDMPFITRDDSGAVMTARVEKHDHARKLTGLRVGGALLWVLELDRELDSLVRVRVPAREVIMAAAEPGPTSVHNVLAGCVRGITQEGAERSTIVDVALPDGPDLLARVTPDAIERLALTVGGDVVALVKSMSIEILPG
jgi:molybdate transport system ATP-binding protein